MTAITFPEVFDSSTIAGFKSCPQLFKKTYIQHWKPKGLSVHLHAGKAFAFGLEVARRSFFEEGQNAELSVARGLGALLTSYGNFECPADSAKSAERTAGALEYYFENYPLSWGDGEPTLMSNGKRGIEFGFVHPLPIEHPETGNPLLYCGRMDALINYAGGIYICDEKTTTSLGATWGRQWDLRAQFTGYAWGCRQAGIRVEGAVIRGVSILKTKYETQQPVTYRPDWQIDRWYEELLLWIQDIQLCWQRERDGRKHAWRHNLDHTCAEYGGCAFRQCCASQDESPWLETYFEQRRWDPVLREEIPL